MKRGRYPFKKNDLPLFFRINLISYPEKYLITLMTVTRENKVKPA